MDVVAFLPDTPPLTSPKLQLGIHCLLRSDLTSHNADDGLVQCQSKAVNVLVCDGRWIINETQRCPSSIVGLCNKVSVVICFRDRSSLIKFKLTD